MYSPDDIVGFACAFYGCLFAGVVPVPIHPPIQKDVSCLCCSIVIIIIPCSKLYERQIH